MEDFGRIVGGLDYPMVVVTAAGENGPVGCLVGFWTQCSIRPPRLLVCVSKVNHTYAEAVSAGWLAVHVLGSDDLAVAERFGSLTADSVDKFAGTPWHPGPEGVPVIDECDRWIAGPVLARFELGDHDGFLVEPRHGDAGSTMGQLSFSAVRRLPPGHPA